LFRDATRETCVCNLLSPGLANHQREKSDPMQNALLCDYDVETFAAGTARAMGTSQVWTLDDDEVWTLVHRVATRYVSDDDVCLFTRVLLARAIPAESMKRALKDGVERCTIEMPRLYEDPNYGPTIRFDVLLRADEDHTEEGSVIYVVRPDGWRCECQGWGGSRIVEKFSLWRSPPCELGGARRRNARRTQRRRLRNHREYMEAVSHAELRRERLHEEHVAALRALHSPASPFEWSEA
jgi:hypothetical protein